MNVRCGCEDERWYVWSTWYVSWHVLGGLNGSCCYCGCRLLVVHLVGLEPWPWSLWRRTCWGKRGQILEPPAGWEMLCLASPQPPTAHHRPYAQLTSTEGYDSISLCRLGLMSNCSWWWEFHATSSPRRRVQSGWGTYIPTCLSLSAKEAARTPGARSKNRINVNPFPSTCVMKVEKVRQDGWLLWQLEQKSLDAWLVGALASDMGLPCRVGHQPPGGSITLTSVH